MEAPGLQNLGWMLGSIPRRRAYDLRLRYRRYGTLLIRTAHPASKSLVGIVSNSRVIEKLHILGWLNWHSTCLVSRHFIGSNPVLRAEREVNPQTKYNQPYETGCGNWD